MGIMTLNTPLKKEFIIKNAQIVNEGQTIATDIRVVNDRIEKIGHIDAKANDTVIDIHGKWLFPGVIDDQVHFREPGLTHKADIYHESRAAVAGGVTSFMDMPNVNPVSQSMEHINAKKLIASSNSLANYAFYLGATDSNIEDIKSANPQLIAGIKIFMGSSTGSLVVKESALENIFKNAPTLIATHCEDDERINKRYQKMQEQYGDDIPAAMHSVIRDEKACYDSSAKAVALAKKTNARLHILHITTADELALFEAGTNIDKQITAEVCAHHLLFNEDDYATWQHCLKCNPSIKSIENQNAIKQALLNSTIDVLATDHAPHLWEEKQQPYKNAPAGLPTIEYAMPAHLQLLRTDGFSMPDIARLTAHRVADLFKIQLRGYIREGYFADFVIVEKTPKGLSGVRAAVISKCAWTPFTNYHFDYRVHSTYVNGNCVWSDDTLNQSSLPGNPLYFDR